MRADVKFVPNKVATAGNAAKVDASPPMFQLVDAVRRNVKNPPKGECVVYWMRMEDLRSKHDISCYGNVTYKNCRTQ